MRMRSRNAYKNEAYLLPKTYKANNVVEYSDVGQLFYYGNYQGKKETIETEIRVIENSNIGRMIITNSPLPFKRDDRIAINGDISIVSKIEIESDLTYGALRNRPNRNTTIITLA